MKNTNTVSRKELNATVKAYILNAIDGTGYGKTFNSDSEKLQFVYDCFNSEAYNRQPKRNRQAVFAEWLQGLPSSFNVDFENYRIIEIAKQWGSLPQNASVRAEDNIINNWFNFIACKFLQLHSKIK